MDAEREPDVLFTRLERQVQDRLKTRLGGGRYGIYGFGVARLRDGGTAIVVSRSDDEAAAGWTGAPMMWRIDPLHGYDADWLDAEVARALRCLLGEA